MLLKRGAVDRVNGTKAMLERRSGAKAAQFGLNHRTQIAGGVVTKFDYAAGLAFKNDDHALSNLGCWNCHSDYLSSYFDERYRQEPRWCCKRRSLAACVRHVQRKTGTRQKQNEQALLCNLAITSAACSLS